MQAWLTFAKRKVPSFGTDGHRVLPVNEFPPNTIFPTT